MSRLQDLPAVHALIAHPRLARAIERHGHAMVVEAARESLGAARDHLRAAEAGAARPDADVAPVDGSPRHATAIDATEIDATVVGGTVIDATAVGATPAETDLIGDLVDEVLARLDRWLSPRPRRVINATGVILHTNLGRAPLSQAAAAAIRMAAASYTDLEYHLGDGRRGSRHDVVAPLLCRLTGAEAALVVNNNAGATLLILAALARGRGVVVSRGQLVEIGGGYRIPDVMAAGGARLVEVGTTNRTRIADYRAAVDDTVALLLRVHTSNYRVVGFTEEAALGELVALGREIGRPVVDDLGSGSLIDTARFGLAREPMVQDSIASGADLVAFSGDKLLGGPQAGVIVGRSGAIAQLRRHPLTRALRPGKDTLAALHATLVHYAAGEALTAIPIWHMISHPAAELRARAAAWRIALAADAIPADLVDGDSTIGGGSLPGETLPTTLLALAARDADGFMAALRRADPPVIARIDAGRVLFDPRTVMPDEEDELVAAIRNAGPSPTHYT